MDKALRFESCAYLFKIKLVEQSGQGSAMAQLKQRGCADQYRGKGGAVRLVAVKFSSETRSIASFDTDLA